MRRDSRLGDCLSPSRSLALLSSYSRHLVVEFAELLQSAYFAAGLNLFNKVFFLNGKKVDSSLLFESAFHYHLGISFA